MSIQLDPAELGFRRKARIDYFEEYGAEITRYRSIYP